MKIFIIIISLIMLSFTGTSKVMNATEYDIDAVIKASIHLDIHAAIMVSYIPRSMLKGDYGTTGFVMKNHGNSYTIFVIRSMPKPMADRTLYHEMIHIKQYEDGDLEQISSGEIKWKGESFKTGEHKQKDMPHEEDATERASKMMKDIRKSGR